MKALPATSSSDHPTSRAHPLLAGPVVVGFDGSPAAVRALDLLARALAPDSQLLVVTVDPQERSHGLLSEPLIESALNVNALLAGARERVADVAPALRTSGRSPAPASEATRSSKSRASTTHG